MAKIIAPIVEIPKCNIHLNMDVNLFESITSLGVVRVENKLIIEERALRSFVGVAIKQEMQKRGYCLDEMDCLYKSLITMICPENLPELSIDFDKHSQFEIVDRRI